FSGFEKASEILPSDTYTSPTASLPVAGSTTRPFLMWRRICRCALSLVPRHDAHHGHAHRDAEGDLRQDHRMRTVGHRGVDLDAAVHRSRVHDDGVGFGERQLVGGQAVVLVE